MVGDEEGDEGDYGGTGTTFIADRLPRYSHRMSTRASQLEIAEEEIKTKEPMSWCELIVRLTVLIVSMYAFIIGLELMSLAFKVLGGTGATDLMTAISNPVVGLMVGILATVLVQSSSTSTSIVVALVAANQMSVEDAIPVVMGANIGTSITNTLVAMGHMADKLELERSFAGATVHDMFNMLSVAVLLPCEIIFQPIYRITKAMTDAVLSEGMRSGGKIGSPLKLITSPVIDRIIQFDKDLLQAYSLGPPDVNGTVDVTRGCEPGSSPSLQEVVQFLEVNARRLQLNCTATPYSCLNNEQYSSWLKVPNAEDAQWSCEGKGVNDITELCATGAGTCWLDADRFFQASIAGGDVIEGGIMADVSNTHLAGLLTLALSLAMLIGGLFVLVKMLKVLIMGQARNIVTKGLNMNDYLAILVGAAATVLVQSSSVVTSLLTPLVGVGVLPVAKMMPLCLGANVGTTFTGILAATATMKPNGIQIAFCHLMFNVLGIIIWFPIPFMRAIPIGAACLLGMYSSYYTWVPMAYIFVAFVLAPLAAVMCHHIKVQNYNAGVAAECAVAAFVLLFVVWWNCLGGAYKFLSQQQREDREFEISARAVGGLNVIEEAEARARRGSDNLELPEYFATRESVIETIRD